MTMTAIWGFSDASTTGAGRGGPLAATPDPAASDPCRWGTAYPGDDSLWGGPGNTGDGTDERRPGGFNPGGDGPYRWPNPYPPDYDDTDGWVPWRHEYVQAKDCTTDEMVNLWVRSDLISEVGPVFKYGNACFLLTGVHSSTPGRIVRPSEGGIDSCSDPECLYCDPEDLADEYELHYTLISCDPDDPDSHSGSEILTRSGDNWGGPNATMYLNNRGDPAPCQWSIQVDSEATGLCTREGALPTGQYTDSEECDDSDPTDDHMYQAVDVSISEVAP